MTANLDIGRTARHAPTARPQRRLRHSGWIGLCLLCLALTGCGGSSGGSDDGSNSGGGSPGTTSHTLTYAAGANGSIDGDSSQSVNDGADGSAVTATAAASYHFVDWSDGSTANPRTDSNVTADISVTANFAVNTYTLVYAAGSNGTIDGEPSQTVNEGADGTAVTATPDAGYRFVSWSDGNTSATRTETNVTADASLTASFALDISAPSGVSATPGNGTVTVAWSAVSGATHYNLCYSTASITTFPPNCSPGGTLVVDLTASPHVVNGLANGTQYFFRVAATLNGEVGPPSVEVTATPSVPPPFSPAGGLNDTGIDWCADDNNVHDVTGTAADKAASCSGLTATHAGQDGMLGRDETARQDAINGTHALVKVGTGDAGFDFSKVCNSGEVAGEGDCPTDPTQGSGADDWGCTRDNVTGLIWEVKTDDAGLRDKDNLYSWYNADPGSNGGGAGVANGVNACTGSDCDTHSYVVAINTATLCGGGDWRLPGIRELQSIVDYGHPGVSLAVDNNFFPNTVGGSYWSSTPNDSALAWDADFNGGSLDTQNKGNGYHVRLVRGGPMATDGPTTCAATDNAAIVATTPTANFTDNDDGTVTDDTTGLMWKRCSQGQTWDAVNHSCMGSGAFYQWQAALLQATGDAFASHSDWRLPNVKELTSIVERKCFSPAINAAVFPNTVTLGYWSSSPQSSGGSWRVHFQTGYTSSGANTTSQYVRLVRDAQ